MLKKKYGSAPEFTKKQRPKPAAQGGGGGDAAPKVLDIRKMDLEDLKVLLPPTLPPPYPHPPPYAPPPPLAGYDHYQDFMGQ